MAKAKVVNPSSPKQRIRPSLDPDTREKQMISLAMDLVEQRLLDGTASSQETVHFLKIGSQKHQAEMEKLREENKLLRAKTEHLEASKVSSAMYEEALKAMRNYAGYGDPDEYED